MIWKYVDVDYRKILILIFIWYISDKFWHYWLVLKPILGSLSAENGEKNLFWLSTFISHVFEKFPDFIFEKKMNSEYVVVGESESVKHTYINICIRNQ